jgi:hypothetical protein
LHWQDAALPRKSSFASLVAIALLLAAGTIARIWVAGGELWLDEIWSLSFARDMTAPWQVVTAIHHDNNHPLNTLWLWAVVKIAGPHAPPLMFRLLPLVTGIGTIALIFWTERHTAERDAPAAPWLAAILAATSFLGLVYSTEARGYAPAAFFALAAFAYVRQHRMETARDRFVFAALCALGILSHLTFLFVYAGLAAWTFVRYGGAPWRKWLALHQLPAAAIAGVYLIDARRLVYGGGPPFSISDVMGRALSQLAGGPASGTWRIVAAAAIVLLIAHGLTIVARTRREEAVFFATALVLAPAAVLTVYHARYLDVRYFFVLFPFVWLLGARALANLAASSRTGRLAAVSIAALSFAGNVHNALPLLRDGRGHYMEIVSTMAQLTSSETITVGSDHDFRNSLVLEYYAEKLPRDRRVIYVPSGSWTPESPEWIVTHDFGPPRSEATQTPHQSLDFPRYVPVRCVPYAGISGWNWCLYRELGGSGAR